ncbi:hypothetical protein FEM48_Zijuj07G0064600 [Ziziphus jujuba var. spinosa]|uniref:Tr-type G domain-containing protein n=1 Tax=Ziziphus jujuba var. spinosa TaxID=714518 RepID=A0A978V307_ZIZJJ|nr:hypothetical protein FEM48_Zijuj07G0064600 [Ziziphus jujuba var. spinosa]
MGHLIEIFGKEAAEREHGITTDNARWKFKTHKYHFTYIYVHRNPDFIKNMRTGASRADCALLMIDCTSGGFEVGFSRNGLTNEHTLMLASTLDVKQMICCGNMMDATTPNYSKERYDEIEKSTSSYVKKLGYDPVNIHFVPISGLEGDKMIESSPNLPWYKGPTLLDALDQIQVPNGGKTIKSSVMRRGKQVGAVMVNGVKRFETPSLDAAVAGAAQVGVALATLTEREM